MRKLIHNTLVFIKDKTRNLRWIIAGALTLVAGSVLFVFAFINTSSIRDTLIQNSVRANQQSVHLTYLHLKDYHDEIVRRGSLISDEIQRVSEQEEPLQQKMADMYHMNMDIDSIKIYNQNGDLVTYEPAYLEVTEQTNLFTNDWYEKYPDNLQIILSAPHLQNTFVMQPTWVISLIKNISINNKSYIMVVDFDFSQVGDFFNRITIGERGYAYIADRNGEILFHPKQGQFTEKDQANVQSVLFRGDGTYVTENEEHSIGYRTISHTGWMVVGVSYLDDIFMPALSRIQKITLYILFVMIILILVVSFLVSKFISQPITRMVRKIEQAEQNESSERINETRFNEVRQLSESYNRQMEEISQLMKQIKEEQEELRKSEMNVLQAQINPHFLYNTLDSILWMAQSGEIERTSDMVAALGKLLRISLSRGENLIPLQKELEHAESYLIIQKFRYNNLFTYSIEADENLFEYLTVKIVIQPFLENALYHGIEHMVDQGHISIKVFEENDNIVIQISDDGMGMTPERLEVVQKLKDSKETGIGIRNVHQRIQVYFGEEYGINIESEMDIGTTVTIIFPKILK